MSKKIILYDLASALKPQAWSPNCWKARYVLNYKRLPYETVYVSYPDIANLWQTLGLSPLEEEPSTTLPVISVPSKDGGPPSVIVDSFNIALFLDHEYPETPRVIPPNTGALQAAFPRALAPLIPFAVAALISPTLLKRLDPKGAVYYRETRGKKFKFDDFAPALGGSEPQDARTKALKGLQKNLNTVLNIIKANSTISLDYEPLDPLASPTSPPAPELSGFPGISELNNQNQNQNDNDSKDGHTNVTFDTIRNRRSSSVSFSGYHKWVMGPIGPTFADFVLGSHLMWIKTMGDDELWSMVSSWNGGRWARHLDKLEPWSQVL